MSAETVERYGSPQSWFSICVLYRADGRERTRSWEYVRERLSRQVPSAQIVAADAGGKTFSMSASRNLAARASSGDLLAFLDADIILEDGALVGAASMARDRPMIAYDQFVRLSREESALVYDGADATTFDIRTRPVTSSAFLLTREAFESVGRFDERFVGWGGEDNAFREAVGTILRPPRRYPSTAYHLWHRIGAKTHRNRDLLGEYIARRGDRDAMASYIEGRGSV